MPADVVKDERGNSMVGWQIGGNPRATARLLTMGGFMPVTMDNLIILQTMQNIFLQAQTGEGGFEC
jgi:hypothetical protein